MWQADFAGADRVPVARPKLPTVEQITPYLRGIDQTRWYSNGGPCTIEFERRLALHCGGKDARVTTVANATLGIALALMASELPERTLCMVPSWTFAGTAHAILLAGLVPWIVDVNSETWTLQAEAAREILADAPGPVSAVIPVGPFGAPVGMAQWQKFREDTGVTVVIDAAAGFDTVSGGVVPEVVSLHATKACGVGEGGFVASTDGTFIEEIKKRANFGFWNSRESAVRSLNGKLSEYAAAIGLASLDQWPETRSDFSRVAQTYRRNLAGYESIRLQPGFGEGWISSTVMCESTNDDAETLTRRLAENGIGTRRWWGGGLHRHRCFQDFPRHCVSQTETLAKRVVGLPCWRDLPDETIAKVCAIVRSV
jgi:dTDP-4-amino-4,6-dideoxygalactose transaminase